MAAVDKPVFSHRIEVRFRDCDPMGHANNAVYLTYLEQARLAHWRALWGFGLGDVPPGTPGVILARAEIDYRVAAKYGDRLEVRLTVAGLGRTSFTYEYEIVDAAGRLMASARTVQVMYDYGRAVPVPIPGDIRLKLRPEQAG
jgi:acyl-CoA thioester hydrolase